MGTPCSKKLEKVNNFDSSRAGVPSNTTLGDLSKKRKKKRFVDRRGVTHHGQPVVMLSGSWLRVFDPCSSSSSQLYWTLSLSSPSLSKTSITNLQFSPLSYSIHPKFFPISSNFFLFIQFLHKYFNFLAQIHPKSPSTLPLFHSKFTPFLSIILHLSSQNSLFLFPFLFL